MKEITGKLKNLIETLKKEEMTRVEKALVYSKIVIKTEKETQPAQSPYFSGFSFTYFARIAGAFVMIAVLGVSGLSYASASALPGELLYKVKTELKEKIEEKFAFTSEKRIALRQQRIKIRFSEAETLIKEKKITPEKLSIVEAKILEDKQEIGNALEEINKENPEIATEAKTDLEAAIEESGEKINTLIEENNIVNITGEEVHYGEIDLELDGEVIDTPIIPTDEVPTDTPTLPIDDSSVIQDLKVVPETGSPAVPLLEEIDGINTDTN